MANHAKQSAAPRQLKSYGAHVEVNLDIHCMKGFCPLRSRGFEEASASKKDEGWLGKGVVDAQWLGPPVRGCWCAGNTAACM
mmetsp:Transcript_7246/g.17191  ORF Transcript_7246/g.17191 Transcript_7246/m.17191 type:complete len:82 (+) Transcript_7246:56-301(+)